MTKGSNLAYFASDVAFAIDSTGRVVAWNKGAEGLLGHTEKEALGRPCYALLQAVLPDGHPLCTPNCPLKQSFLQCRPHPVGACLCRHRDGRWVPVSLSNLAIPQTFPGDGALAVVLLRPLEGAPAPTQGSILRIFTLGSFGLTVGDRTIPLGQWKRKQALLVLKYLVTYWGQAVHRGRLVECLWREASEGQGRQRLKVTVHSLRRQLQEAGCPPGVIETAGEAYRLSPLGSGWTRRPLRG